MADGQPDRLQQTGYRESGYERPSQEWVCGHLRDGVPCTVGPGPHGRCRAIAACRPAFRDERWHCTRLSQHGGRCVEGPGPEGQCAHPVPPCQPVRGLRAKRRVFGRWVVLATLGLLMVVGGGGSATREVAKPGPLATAHGEIGDCGECHAAPAAHPPGWVAASFVPDSEIVDSRRCTQCHRFGADALHAHSVPPARLLPVTAATADSPWTTAPGASPVPATVQLAGLIGGPVPADAEIACATCHREHRGRHAPLSAMDDARCQSCHVRRFESLADGHPPFSNYPHERRTRIIFDHASHIGKHFANVEAGEAPTACTGCHDLGPGGVRMIVQPYATVCAGCHADDVAGEGLAGPKGIAVLEVPGIDVDTLAAEGYAIGEWPAYAEAPLNPFMRFLLSADGRTREAVARLADVDLLDLRTAEPAVLDAAAAVAWAVKKLLADMTERGHAAIADRIAASAGVMPTDDVLSGLLGRLPVAALRESREAWFPGLVDEVARHRAGLSLGEPLVDQPAPVEAAEPEPADPAPSDADEDGGLLGGGGLLEGGGGLLEAAPEDDGGDLLGGGGLLAEDTADEADMPEGGGLLGGDLLGGDLLGGDLLDAPSDASVESAVSVEAEVEVPTPVDPEPWMRAGGWYRDHFALRYRPAGHEDRFIRSWLSLQPVARGGPGSEAAEAVFAALTAAKGPGACMLCHSVDAVNDGGGRSRLLVNWQALPPPDTRHHFTRYAHRPHFSLLDERGCLTCHKLDPAAPYAESFVDRDPTVFAGNFEPMEKDVCAACHTGDRAGDRCTDCHGYHVGDFPPALAEAPLTLDESAQGDR